MVHFYEDLYFILLGQTPPSIQCVSFVETSRKAAHSQSYIHDPQGSWRLWLAWQDHSSCILLSPDGIDPIAQGILGNSLR